MGVDTKAILRKETTLEQIVERIEAKYGKVEVEPAPHDKTFFNLYFKEPCPTPGSATHRGMAVFFGNCAKHDYNIDGVLLSLSHWGSSVEIMKWLLDEFGGFLDEQDCDDKDFYEVKGTQEIRYKKLTKLIKTK